MKKFSPLAIIAVVALFMTSPGNAQEKPMRDILPLPASVFDASGNEIPTESLRGKIVALYFSAQWCVPCKKFTPKLIEFRERHNADNFEVVFMSLDRSPEQKSAYMKEAGMNWLTAPGQGTPEINHIMDYYKLAGVPSLIVFGPRGKVITTEGRDDVTNSPGNALAKWQAAIR